MPTWISMAFKLFLLVCGAITQVVGFLVVMIKLLTATINLIREDNLIRKENGEDQSSEDKGTSPDKTNQNRFLCYIAEFLQALANILRDIASFLSKQKTYVRVPQDEDDNETNGG